MIFIIFSALLLLWLILDVVGAMRFHPPIPLSRPFPTYNSTYPYEANCTAEVEFGMASYFPLNACNQGSVYTSCTGKWVSEWVGE